MDDYSDPPTDYDLRLAALRHAGLMQKPDEHVNNLLLRAEKVLAFLKGEPRVKSTIEEA